MSTAAPGRAGVFVVDRDLHRGRRLARLIRPVVDAQVIAHLKDLSASAQDISAVLLHHSSAAENQLQEHRSPCSALLEDGKILWIEDVVDTKRMATLLGTYGLRHLLPETALEAGDAILLAIRRFISHVALSADAFVSSAAERLDLKAAGTHSRADVLQQVRTFASRVVVSPRVVDDVVLCTDELLVNAMFHAPADGSGAHLFSKLHRDAALTAPQTGEISILVRADGRRIVMEVRDSHGSAKPLRLRDFLARGFYRGDNQVHEGSGGAGIGLYTLAQMADAFAVDVDVGVSTRMIVSLPSNKIGSAEIPKQLHLFS